MTKFRGLLEATKIHRSNAPEVLSDWTPLSRRGRPPGKRSDPDFEQITAYIRKDTHHAVKIALLTNGCRDEAIPRRLGCWEKSLTAGWCMTGGVPTTGSSGRSIKAARST